MALGPRLDLRQSQQLVMTPQLQQAIKLLQLSNLDLAEFISTEVEKNPLLSEGEKDYSAAGEVETGEGGGTASDDNMREAPTGDFDDTGLSGDKPDDSGLIAADKSLDTGFDTADSNDSALDTDLNETVFHHDSVADMGGASGGLSLDGIEGGNNSFNSAERSIDQTLEGEIGLHDHLANQMAMILTSPQDQLIGSHLVDMVDDAGYIPAEVTEDLAERLGTDQSHVETVLGKMQNMDPTGVFARSLGECLALQLREQDRFDPAMEALIDNLELVAKRDMANLKRLCGVDDEDLSDMLLELRGLNPKPGLAFGSVNVTPVVPDVFIKKNRAGSWIVELNTETLPKVLVNNQYMSELEEVGGNKETKAFVSDCLVNANWLVKALDQRARTILKVSSALIKSQEMFFEHGIRYLKPMTLKDIADEIDMHESTVSRVTSNKFLSCPRGLFELKYFFTSAISSTHGGDALSAESVKFRIKELIDAEPPKKILSDDKLVELLKSEGIDIARRTVAKYREAMRIPSSVQRRRQKAV